MLDDGTLFLPGILTLAPGRAHEFCGPARRVLAAWAMAQSMAPGAPALWLRLRHNPDRLYPHGLAEWALPGGLVLAEAPRTTELLGCAEDGLRSGACALVVLDLAEPVAMTPLRRLHLAAEDGSARRPGGVRALVLTPGDGGTPGVETRWHLAPCAARARSAADPVGAAWRLSRLRARMTPPACWHVQDDGDGLHLVAGADPHILP